MRRHNKVSDSYLKKKRSLLDKYAKNRPTKTTFLANCSTSNSIAIVYSTH